MFALPTPESLPVTYRCEPVFEYRSVAGGRPDPWNQPGTGGVSVAGFWISDVGVGYRQVLVKAHEEPESVTVQLMSRVKAGFGRTFTHLPAVFNVSRQTLYNWLSGDAQPRQDYQARLRQLADAADVFAAAGLKLTAHALERPIRDGKSFLELLADGEDGATLADKLVRMERRGAARSAQIDALLTGQANVEGSSIADYSAPALTEGL